MSPFNKGLEPEKAIYLQAVAARLLGRPIHGSESIIDVLSQALERIADRLDQLEQDA